MGSIFDSSFDRSNTESNLHKRAILFKKKIEEKYKVIILGLVVTAALIGIFLTGGTILLLFDGGITVAFLISQLTLKIYDSIIEKYMKNISKEKKRDFLIEIHKFYKETLMDVTNDNDNNPLKILINKFIDEEKILEKTTIKFEEKRNKIINDSNESKAKFNILIIGPTGSGKSTLINEFFKIKEAKESYGEVGTLNFHKYTTSDSRYNLIDSQGLDYSMNINDYTKILEKKIIEYNKHPNSFIDMIYYCTNHHTRIEIQEIELIQTLERLYDLNRIPLIIINTMCTSDSMHLQFKEFIDNKYEGKYTIIKILARDIDNIKANGMENLKRETEKKINNISESAYYGKFIANVSKNLYKEYTDNIFKTLLKGIFKASKEESIENVFYKLLNMYRFQKSNIISSDSNLFSDNQKIGINNLKNIILENYDKKIDDFLKILIRYNAESEICYQIEEKNITDNEKEEQIEELYNSYINNNYNKFKDDIDTMLFPCLLDILKTTIVLYFNRRIMEHLSPKIKELMAH